MHIESTEGSGTIVMIFLPAQESILGTKFSTCSCIAFLYNRYELMLINAMIRDTIKQIMTDSFSAKGQFLNFQWI